MATTVYPAMVPKTNTWIKWRNPHTEACGPRQCVKGDPKDTVSYHKPLRETSHTVLQVLEQDSPGPKRFSVNVFNGFNGKKASVTVRSTDTIGKLQQRILKLNPDLIRDQNLVFNGKPVELHQTLSELQVKPGATFLTFMRCNGG